MEPWLKRIKKNFVVWVTTLSTVCPPNLFAVLPHDVPGNKGAPAANYTPLPVYLIDSSLNQTWKRAGVAPSGPATDGEFIRRAYLDFLGKAPTLEELNEFTASPSANKKKALCQRLVRSPDFLDYWALRWAHWLGDGKDETPQEAIYPAMLPTASAILKKRNFSMDKVVYDLLATQVEAGKATPQKSGPGWGAYGGWWSKKGSYDPYQVAAQQFLLTHAGEPTNQNEGRYNLEPATEITAKLFLGIRLECAKCHDHPFQKWTQEDYWSMNSALASTRKQWIQNQEAWSYNSAVPYLADTDPVSVKYAPSVLNPSQSSTTPEASPRYLDGKALQGNSARQALAQRIIEDPLFSKAMVNRMWAALFGLGLNGELEPDDFQIAEGNKLNDVVHPELLEQLAKEFKKSGYRLDTLMEWICQSQAYQLSSRANSSNEEDGALPLFSRMPMKLLSLSQMENSISAVDQVPHPATRPLAFALFEAGFRPSPLKSAAERMTPQQALMLFNGEEIRSRLWDSKVANQEPSFDAIRNAFLATLGRKPSPDELSSAAKLAAIPRTNEEIASEIQTFIKKPVGVALLELELETEERLAKKRAELRATILRQVKAFGSATNSQGRDAVVREMISTVEKASGTPLTPQEKKRILILLAKKNNLVDVYGMLFNTAEFTHTR